MHYRIVITGAGIAGVGLGVRLRQAGVKDFVILERNDSVGGTWYEHTYPGCGCDIPTHLYSYSFARNPNWSRLFPRQDEIASAARCSRRGVADDWTDGGCKAYYTDDNGRNFAIYPGFASDYRRRTRKFDVEPYVVVADARPRSRRKRAAATGRRAA